MKAPVADWPATVPRTQASATVTCAAAGSAKVAAASARAARRREGNEVLGMASLESTDVGGRA